MTELKPFQYRRRVFISGPMTNCPAWNHPAFHAAAAHWRANGFDVYCPAEAFGGRTDLPRAAYMRVHLKALPDYDVLAQLPGWISSEGAWAEYVAARACGLEIVDA